ncbi:MAG TPA: AtpZ/AtpI family protein [Anaerolineaceae bacterium]|nr:AtpZ/AtpI family protein [Anaerolineaceae bacterium]
MQPEKSAPVDRKTKIFNLTLASVAGQVGCLTLLIVIAALFGGLWLDNRFDSKPMYTIGMLIVSIPISLGVMFFVVRLAISKIKTSQPETNSDMKEVELGKN